MMEKRPNVFPTGSQEPKQQRNEIRTDRLADTPVHNVSTDSDYDKRKLEVADEVYTNSSEAVMSTGSPMADAIEAMRKRTEEQIKLRNERLAEMQSKTQNYQQQFEEAKQRTQQVEQVKPESKVLSSEPKSPIKTLQTSQLSMNTDSYIQQLSQPQFNTAFDLLPLPSEGKLYKNKKANVKVAYMTTADENILTSPNLLQSGQFLEILINRKLLETDLRYRDLHIGDRNAIMLWLRATAFGEMYPVTMFDEDGNPFETEIDLSTLKTKKLTIEPDVEGLFEFTLPISKASVKFKLLTVGDVEDIETMIEEDERNELPINNANTYRLQKQIVEVNGERNKTLVNDFINNMRIRDAKELREYIDKIDCGIDLEIEIGTPRGGSIKTFLPLNRNFFWPDLSI